MHSDVMLDGNTDGICQDPCGKAQCGVISAPLTASKAARRNDILFTYDTSHLPKSLSRIHIPAWRNTEPQSILGC